MYFWTALLAFGGRGRVAVSRRAAAGARRRRRARARRAGRSRAVPRLRAAAPLRLTHLETRCRPTCRPHPARERLGRAGPRRRPAPGCSRRAARRRSPRSSAGSSQGRPGLRRRAARRLRAGARAAAHLGRGRARPPAQPAGLRRRCCMGSYLRQARRGRRPAASLVRDVERRRPHGARPDRRRRPAARRSSSRRGSSPRTRAPVRRALSASDAPRRPPRDAGRRGPDW